MSEYNVKTTCIQCALLNAYVYAECATLAPRLALIFRGRIAYNAGYCRSLYFSKDAARQAPGATSGKRENSELRAYVGGMYGTLILRAASATLCVHVREMLLVQSWRWAGVARQMRVRTGKKFIARDAARRVHNSHNALFALVSCVASESAEIVYVHTFVGAVKRLCTACFQSVYLRCSHCFTNA